MEILEKMYQGYCRTSDQSRIVTCEFHMEEDRKIMDYADCLYVTCVHSKNCKLMEKIRADIFIPDIQDGLL